MPNVTVTNTVVIEAIPSGSTFTPSTGVVIRANVFASTGGEVELTKGGNSTFIAAGSQNSTESAVTVWLTDSVTIKAVNDSAGISGVVVDS